MKKCSKCKETKDLESFANSASRKDGKQAMCRSCHQIAKQRWYGNNKENARVYNRQRKFGIGQEEFDFLFLKQNKTCKICGAVENVNGRGWSVDHSHKTGAIRGILCHHCNILLGHAKDSTEILVKAIHYLDENNE